MPLPSFSKETFPHLVSASKLRIQGEEGSVMPGPEHQEVASVEKTKSRGQRRAEAGGNRKRGE